MFEALRWRLTAWYVLAFAIVFASIGAVVFVWAGHRLSSDVDRAVRDVSDAARLEVARDGDVVASEDSVRSILVSANLSGSADVFVLLLAPNGDIVANPGAVPTGGLPARDAVVAASTKGEDWRSFDVDGQPLQLRTIAVRNADATLLGYVQAGKSVEERDESLRTLEIVLAGGGIAGLAFATVGGLLVAAVAIRPVRRSFDRQREFVADASHELRTPLAVIRANSETLATIHPADEALDDIVTETSYMTRLLDDLLLLAGGDSDGIALQRIEIDVAEIARAAARAAAPLAADAGLRIHEQIAAELPVVADPERLREVLLILLDNAIKYTPRGGSVELRAHRDRGDAVIVVTDTGVGVPPEHINRLFDRFYRVDKARSRAAGGTGLGLAIARELIDAHGGTITIESAESRGTTVTVRLQLRHG